MELSPLPGPRAVLLQLAGDVALARGDLAGAAESAAACRDALARFGYRHENHLPLVRLEIELPLAQDRHGDGLTAGEDAPDRHDLPVSPRYAWPLLTVAARACAGASTGPAAARDRDRANRARRLLDRLRAQAGKMDAAVFLQEAHRLTFAAEAARARGAAGGPGATPPAGWDAAAEAWDHLGQPYLLACALLRGAEAAMDAGDRDGAAERLARAPPLADRRGAGAAGGQTGTPAPAAPPRPSSPPCRGA